MGGAACHRPAPNPLSAPANLVDGMSGGKAPSPRRPDPAHFRKLELTTNYKACPVAALLIDDLPPLTLMESIDQPSDQLRVALQLEER